MVGSVSFSGKKSHDPPDSKIVSFLSCGVDVNYSQRFLNISRLKCVPYLRAALILKIGRDKEMFSFNK